MMDVSKYSRRMSYIAALSLLSILFTGLFMMRVHAQPLESRDAGTSAPSVVTSTENESIHEVHIANNGLVLLRGAHITSITGSMIRVNLAIGSFDFAWTVETSTYTKFLTSAGEKKTLADIEIGDIVTVTGKLHADATKPIIDADFIRA